MKLKFATVTYATVTALAALCGAQTTETGSGPGGTEKKVMEPMNVQVDQFPNIGLELADPQSLKVKITNHYPQDVLAICIMYVTKGGVNGTEPFVMALHHWNGKAFLKAGASFTASSPAHPRRLGNQAHIWVDGVMFMDGTLVGPNTWGIDRHMQSLDEVKKATSGVIRRQ